MIASRPRITSGATHNAYPVRFSLHRVREILTAVEAGRPIAAPIDGWDGWDYVQLAGVLLHLALSSGPQPIVRQSLGDAGEQDQVQLGDPSIADLHDAIEIVADLTALLAKSDHDFPPLVHLAVFRDGGGKQRAEIIPPNG